MSKRIKELAEQARHWAHFDGLARNPTSSPDILFERKFAELIIREAAEIATKNQYKDCNAGYYVLQEFGIDF